MVKSLTFGHLYLKPMAFGNLVSWLLVKSEFSLSQIGFWHFCQAIDFWSSTYAKLWSSLNFGPVTDRQWCIRAHRAYAQAGWKMREIE